MNSKIIGRVRFDRYRLQQELTRILALEYNREYSEFVSGGWTNCVLWNGTGWQEDNLLRDYDGSARPTPLAESVPYVGEVVASTFNVEYIKWLRVFAFFGNGKLLPHRDFLEVERAFTRLHLPLQTNGLCLHSEEDTVFHMRSAEIWFLDTQQIHSACNLSDRVRVSLVVDFVPGIPMEGLVKAPCRCAPLPGPHIVERPLLSRQELDTIHHLACGLTEQNFVEVLWDLAEIHFRRQVGASDMFDWLDEIARRSGKPRLTERAEAIRRFFTEGRYVGERFSLAA